jgi:hypothetical protein
MNDSQQPINVALVTGGHGFDVPALHAVFHDMPDVRFWPQDLQDFTMDYGKVADWYDVVVLYIFYHFKPGDSLPGYFGKTFEAMSQLGRPGQGVLILHHGMLAFPEWPEFDQMVGMTNRIAAPVSHDEKMNIEVVHTEHPTTRGLPGQWTIIDETYKLPEAQLMDDNEPLLETDHPDSTPVIAWARRYRQSPVVTYLAGHDRQAMENPHLRTFMHNTIQWLAGRR